MRNLHQERQHMHQKYNKNSIVYNFEKIICSTLDVLDRSKYNLNFLFFLIESLNYDV